MAQAIGLFRAIVGKHSGFAVGPSKIPASGVSDVELRKNGIFTSNFSVDQYGNKYERHLGWRPVPGLPVYLKQENAENVLNNCSYKKDRPALAIAEIPSDLFFGTEAIAKILSNDPSGKGDYELTEENLQNYLSGKMGWEFYISPRNGHTKEELVKAIRPYERLYRPNKLDGEGRIVMKEGFREVKPILETDEARTEIKIS